MLSKTRLAFDDTVPDQTRELSDGLTFLIRTDARYATNGFRKKLLSALQDTLSTQTFNAQAQGNVEGSPLEMAVLKSVHEAYENWGISVLESIGQHMNYNLYEIHNSMNKRMNVEFHDSHALAETIAKNADEFMKARLDYSPDAPVIFISLDEMFHECRAPWGEVAFSRLFSLTGDQQFGYTARPGKSPIEDQINGLAKKVKDLRECYGQNAQLVLLEDNVRHAKMLNWVIDLMNQHGVFENADLACISTCFCSAAQTERESIVHNGQTVPLVVAVQLDSKNFEVSTPRDLFFDGYVVEIEGQKTRLPGLFMDVEKLFKICPEKVATFNDEIKAASLRFCEHIERQWSVVVPVSWFTGAKAISHLTGVSQDAPMRDALNQLGGCPYGIDVNKNAANQNTATPLSPT